MASFNLVRGVFLLLGMGLLAVEVAQSQRNSGPSRIAHVALGVVACTWILVLVVVWINHVNFPLNLDLMESTVLQHFQRAADFDAIYPEPTPAYVPLAYNAFYYVVAIPFSWIFGVNLVTLRLVTILATIGSGLILYRVVKEKTSSLWWGLMTVGLFAAAYRVMDVYLDTAHSDSWLIFTALLGSYIIDHNRSRAWNLVGVVVLVSAFWFKQHGALFAVGGVLFLTWREGLKHSVPYWLTAALLGPIAYLFVGPLAFGSQYHYFTWEVPRNWSELNFATFRRFTKFTLLSYPFLALSGALVTLWTAVKDRNKLSVWHFQFVMAGLTGFMGTLDPGSSDNVYIPMGTWFILMGMLGLHALVTRVESAQRYRVHSLALLFTFVLLMYNPQRILVSSRAQESYDDLVDLLQSLDGNVYAPTLGQLPDGYVLYPAAHWVALEDMIRGPGRDTRNHPNTRQLLEPALDPDGPAYVLANYPFEVYAWLAFLNDYYVLETDFGDRFEPLRVLPARWDHGWPRYLYRYAPKEAGVD